MTPPTHAQLLNLLREQAPAEYDELAFFATDDPLTFLAMVMSAHSSGRITLSDQLRRAAHRALQAAARARVTRADAGTVAETA